MTAIQHNSNKDECSLMVWELAAKLHQTGGEALALDLAPSEAGVLSISLAAGIHLEGLSLKYNSLAIRNQFAAEYHFNITRNSIAPGDKKWLAVCHEIWRHEIGAIDRVSGRL